MTNVGVEIQLSLIVTLLVEIYTLISVCMFAKMLVDDNIANTEIHACVCV